MLNRRYFLKVYSSVTPFLLKSKKKSKNTNFFMVKNTTIFPKPLTVDEYNEAMNSYKSINKEDNIFGEYILLGKILDWKHEFNSSHSTWTVIYRSEKDYKAYIDYYSSMNCYNFKLAEQYGFKFTKTMEKINSSRIPT